MESSRRRDTRQQCGLDDSKEREEIAKAVAEEEKRRKKKEEKRMELLETPTFQAMTTIKRIMDDFMLDPIVGFFLPAVGDILSALCALPFIYFSLFKVKSVKLTLACIFNTWPTCVWVWSPSSATCSTFSTVLTRKIWI